VLALRGDRPKNGEIKTTSLQNATDLMAVLQAGCVRRGLRRRPVIRRCIRRRPVSIVISSGRA
jgi:hypothetical protein